MTGGCGCGCSMDVEPLQNTCPSRCGSTCTSRTTVWCIWQGARGRSHRGGRAWPWKRQPSLGCNAGGSSDRRKHVFFWGKTLGSGLRWGTFAFQTWVEPCVPPCLPLGEVGHRRIRSWANIHCMVSPLPISFPGDPRAPKPRSMIRKTGC